ncbi:Arp2/3 complex, 34 kd subunit p34-Arc-domain-containing protein [Piptocephalis cylindrospora]|uniref:Arp2/3 complex 34 kDa subunit n=1 Tax=Piptocephalis cylindrospora TaxID=1907219 RepID=A0A4P9XZU6_9FUNG|nr:Arp2/3 complex, 34 kd subunit p34-Arc-domain-containing protein [Piptocephalis cylindrospora]|eukprot:RKP12028.1 Arp2/3 complex, 34 kd subunit p34-Arc-domain-containing protein [Piptocephalis cylindrospora]
MILLDHQNAVLRDTLKARFSTQKQELVNITLVDFDGVTYHVHTPDTDNLGILFVSMRLRCFSELQNYGATDLLRAEFGDTLQDKAEDGWDLTLKFDLSTSPGSEELLQKIANLKTIVLAAPFSRAFDQHDNETADPDLMTIHYRDEETIYVRAQSDRVTVIFSTVFREETDRIFGKVFLQEFVDARKQLALQNAPPVLHSREPPLELKHLPELAGVTEANGLHFITFVLFPRHFAPGPVRDSTIAQLQLFRDYLHYHIKCAKAHMHTRMRRRVAEFLKVLNRAKPERTDKEKKLASGRTFKRN